MKHSIAATTLFLFALMALAAPTLRGDTVQLANGDVLHGTVQWLNEQSLQLHSDVHGEMRIKREKVAAITLGDRQPPGLVANPAALSSAPQASAKPGANAKPATALTVDDVIKHLQTGGIDLNSLDQVQKEFPELAAPEAKKYLTDTLGGLMNGSLGVQDIRRDAIRVRDQVEDLKKTLGPDAGFALEGYMSILNKFISESEPQDAHKQSAAPQPTAPQPAAPGGTKP